MAAQDKAKLREVFCHLRSTESDKAKIQSIKWITWLTVVTIRCIIDYWQLIW